MKKVILILATAVTLFGCKKEPIVAPTVKQNTLKVDVNVSKPVNSQTWFYSNSQYYGLGLNYNSFTLTVPNDVKSNDSLSVKFPIHSTTITAMGDTLFDIDSVLVTCKFYYNDSLVKTVTDTGYNLRYEVDNQHIADFRTITFVKN